jgi:hypothetical protein
MWDIAGDKAKMPGNFSKAENNVHCRCTQAPVIKSKSLFTNEAQIKTYWQGKSAQAESFEKMFKKSYKEAFDKLEKVVLDKLEEVTK